MPAPPLIIGHRGDSSNALENSLDAFRRALAVPVDMIELDLRMAADRSLWVMHDKQTGRTAAPDVDIEQVTASEAGSVWLSNGEPVPTLDNVFDLVQNKAAINIEIKSDHAGAALARHLQSRAALPRLVVSSFKEAEVSAVRSVFPQLDYALIYDAFSSRHISEYRSRGYGLISLRKNTVTEALVMGCHARGLRLFVWTVDAEEEMKRCIEWGVDGLYTNKPALLKEVLERQRATGS
jgi:glycerophosphoryl diester phosphodiesterase